MKSIIEIEEMLSIELSNRLKGERSIIEFSNYYNKSLGDTSFILAGLLEAHLQRKYCEWFINGKWIDDTLIETFEHNGNEIDMSGIVIWGISGQTEQWTDPFKIILQFIDDVIANYNILFGDLFRESLNYTDFKHNRNYWKEREPDWSYIINPTSH